MKNIFIITVLLYNFSVIAQNNKTIPLEAEKGMLLFSDDFERTQIALDWTIKEKFDGAFSIEEGSLKAKELTDAGHGSVARTSFKFSNVIIEFDVQFNGCKRFNMERINGITR